MDKTTQASVINGGESSNEVTVRVKDDPVMQTAVDMLRLFSGGKTLILNARGTSIPNAVAVANILTESMLKGDARIRDITVDGEVPNGVGRMISTIRIVLARD